MTGHYGDDERRDLMERITGKRSTLELSRDEMKQVIDEQQRLLRQCDPSFQRPRRPTWTQETYIAHLVDLLGWSKSPERLTGFIRKETRGWIDSLDRLNRAQKSNLISGLKRLLADERSGKARADRPAAARHPRPWVPQLLHDSAVK
jgi:hypothetical protein